MSESDPRNLPDALRKAGKIDPEEALRLADSLISSRPALFTREAEFSAMLETGGVFHEGLRCRVTQQHPGIVRVYVAHTGELIAESVPGKPLEVAPAFLERLRGVKG